MMSCGPASAGGGGGSSICRVKGIFSGRQSEVNPGRPTKVKMKKIPSRTVAPGVCATCAANFGAIGEIPAPNVGAGARKMAQPSSRRRPSPSRWPRVSLQAATKRLAAERISRQVSRKEPGEGHQISNFRAGCRFSIPLGPPAGEMERCRRKLGNAEDRDRRDVTGCGRPYDTTRLQIATRAVLVRIPRRSGYVSPEIPD